MTPQILTTYNPTSPQPNTFHTNNDVNIVSTSNTPKITYSESKELLIIKGKSTKLDVYQLYQRITGQLKSYLKENDTFSIYLSFESLNTSTAKVLFDLFKFVNLKNQYGGKVQVYWGVDKNHPEILETGKDFAEIYDLDFKFITTE